MDFVIVGAESGRVCDGEGGGKRSVRSGGREDRSDRQLREVRHGHPGDWHRVAEGAGRGAGSGRDVQHVYRVHALPHRLRADAALF